MHGEDGAPVSQLAALCERQAVAPQEGDNGSPQEGVSNQVYDTLPENDGKVGEKTYKYMKLYGLQSNCPLFFPFSFLQSILALLKRKILCPRFFLFLFISRREQVILLPKKKGKKDSAATSQKIKGTRVDKSKKRKFKLKIRKDSGRVSSPDSGFSSRYFVWEF